MVQVRELSSNEQLEQASALYKEVWNSNGNSINERLKKHLTYKGFKGLIIPCEQGSVKGFAYGYTSLAGQYYHDLLAEELNTVEYQRWLKDCFEFVELAVHPSYRSQGYARLLATKLLESVENKTVILTTQLDNQPARSLYKSLGWKDIKENFYPNRSEQAFVIIGKELLRNPDH